MLSKGYVQIDGRRRPERRDSVEAGKNLAFDLYDGEEGRGFEEARINTDFKPFRKTAVTYATQMPCRFFVDTIEGPQQEGQPGDFLVIGLAGEMYPVALDIFLNTYELDEDNA